MNINTTSLHWEEKKLFHGEKKGKFTGTYLEEHPSFPNMYYVVTEKGKSDDFYNIDWAKHHALRLTRRDLGLE